MKKDRICYIDNRPLIYEGRHKIVFDGPEVNTHVLHFKDTVGFDRKPEMLSPLPGKGEINSVLSGFLFERLNDIGIQTHYIAPHTRREQVVHCLEMLPFRVTVRNVASGQLTKRLAIEEGAFFVNPIIEFYSNMSREAGEELIGREHIETLGFATGAELADISDIALRLNDFLLGFAVALGVTLYDTTFEFGRRYNYLLDDTEIALGDEISLDTCHFVDRLTKQEFGAFGVTEGDGLSLEPYQLFFDRCEALMKPAATNVRTSGTVVNLGQLRS